MLRWLAGSSIRLRYLVIPIALALIGLGFVQLRNAPTDVLPEYTAPTVEIQTEALGLAADEVEQLITAPLEANLLNGVAWLDTIRSESVAGLSSIELVFERGTDLFRARQMVQERLTQARALPHVSKAPTMIQPLSSTSRVMMVGLSSQDVSLIDMSVLTRFTIRPRLMGVPGVANVTVFGQRERQLQVHVDPAELAKKGVTLNDVIRSTGNALWVSPLTFLEASTPGTGGFIDTPNQRVGVQHLLPIASPTELAQVAMEGPAGRRLRIGDVATVVADHQPLIGDALVNDAASLMLVVEKFPGSDTRTVTQDVEAALDSMRPGLGGIETDTTIFRPATFLDDARDNIALAWVVGVVMALALLAGLFFAWRLALVFLVVLPLSVGMALAVLLWRGTSVSAVVLVGLAAALVVVVDDVVVTMDAARARADSSTGRSRSLVERLVERLVEVRSTLLFATLIGLVLPVPVLLLNDSNGAFFRPLVLSYALAVLASFVVAATVTPALAAMLIRPGSGAAAVPPAAGALGNGYRGALTRLLARPRWAYGGLALALVAGLAVLPQLGGQDVLPAMQDRNLLIHWEGAPGTSRPEMNRITTRATQELRSTPGVRNVGAHVGRAVGADQVVGINAGEMWVSLHSTADYAKTTSAVRSVLAGYPGLVHRMETYPQARVREISDSASGDVVVRVYGQDADTLRTEAGNVRRLVSGVDGVRDAEVLLPQQEPTLEVQVDLAAAQRYGVKPGDVRRAATTLLSGVEVGNLFEEQKVFEVIVVGAPAVRHSVSSVSELLIETPSGGAVKLGALAAVRIAPNRTVIRREAISPYVDVAATVGGRDRGDVVREIQAQLSRTAFPVEYHAEVLDASTDRDIPIYAYVIAVVLVAFLLLQAATGSWRLAAVLFLALPLALSGALLAAELDGGITALSSFAALLAVSGLAVRWVLLLVRDWQRQPANRERVVEACAARLVPMVMTALAVAAMMLPFAVAGGPGFETVHPVAVMVLGGLVTSLLLALFAAPVLYLRFAGSPPETASPVAPYPQIDLTQPTAPAQEVLR